MMSQQKKSKSLKITFLLMYCCIICFTTIYAQLGPTNSTLTKVSGHIYNPSQKTIGIKFYRDFLSRDEELFEIPLDGLNNFAMSFDLNASTPAFLVYDGVEIPIYLDPTDDVKIHGNGFSFETSISFSGKGGEKSRYLKNFNHLFPETNFDYVIYELADREPMEFRKYMDGIHKRMWQFYNYFNSYDKKKFSNEFSAYVKAEIDYWRAYNLLRYRIEHPIFNGINEPYPLPLEYYSFLEETLISNEQAISNANYLYFLDQYILLKNHLFDSETDIEFNVQSLVVDAPSMLVFSTPNQPPILEQVEFGTPLKFLGVQSKEKSQIQITDKLEEDFWYQVISTKGEKGWIHGSGVKFEFFENDQFRDKISIDHSSKYRNIYELFTGKTLYYLLASDLYWGSSGLAADELEKLVNSFIDLNPYPTYDSLLLSSFDLEKETTNISSFRLVENPTMLSKMKPKKEVVIKEEPIIVVGSSSSSSEKVILNSKNYSSPQPDIDFVEIDPRPVNRQTTSTSFSGSIDSHAGFKPTLKLFTDPITLEEIVHELPVQNNKTFAINLNLSEPTFGKLTYGDKSTEIYLEPGDLMQVNFKGNDFLRTLNFSGKGSKHNNYLKARSIKFVEVDKKAKKNAEILKQNPYKAEMLISKNQKLDFLNNRTDFSEYSSSFQNFAKADIIFWYGYNLLNYCWEYPLANNMDAPMKLSEDFYDFLTDMPISMEGALPNNYYTYFVDQFFEYQSEHADNLGLNDHQLAEKYLIGEPLAYFKAKKLAIACKRGKAKKMGEEIKRFIENNPFETYNDVLRLVYNEAKGLVVGMKAPEFELADINGNVVSLSDLQGKVVYLDFWATWCSPCVQQMKNSKIWKSKFKDKDVAFVYISLDKNKEAWEKFVNNNNIQGYHLAATGKDVYRSQIAKLYKVKKLPWYFLIDKNGKVAFKPTPGQMSGRVQDRINELLLMN